MSDIAELSWINDTRCGWCGRDPAIGFASIDDRYYCHGDGQPSCYEQALWERSGVSDLVKYLEESGD